MSIPQSDGWVRLWRKLLEKRIWKETNANEKVVMIALILMANFEPAKAMWKGKEVILKPGSMIVSLTDIVSDSKINISENIVAETLVRFEKPFEFINIREDKNNPGLKYIKILNWRQYQPDGMSNEESEATYNTAVELYKFYMEKIKPLNKSKQRAVKNIIKYSKKHSFHDLTAAMLNYHKAKAWQYDPSFRKDPANFFGIQEPYFKDFLPGVFKPSEFTKQQNGGSQKNLVLDKKSLAELNE